MDSGRPPRDRKGFSLIEVVIALGICSFAIVAILGMFSIGYRTEADASGEFNAANLASLIVAQRRAEPTDTSATSASPVLPSLDQQIDADWQETTVGWDGRKSNDPNAPYKLRYRAGLTDLNSLSGQGKNSKVALICLSLSWPAGAAASSKSISRYELVTQVNVP